MIYMVKLGLSELNIEKLDDAHDITNFNSSNSDLNGFLVDDSHHQMNNKLSVSYVCTYDSDIAAYFTWCSDSIIIRRLEPEDGEELEVAYKNAPALKLCRLAVDKNFE